MWLQELRIVNIKGFGSGPGEVSIDFERPMRTSQA
jgi:hypothetical protein